LCHNQVLNELELMENKEEKFRQIVSDNETRLLRLCNYYAQEPEDAKDIYQEILINVWKSLDTFRGDSAISTWIYRIAINTSLNFSGKFNKQMKLRVDKDMQHFSSLVQDEDEEKNHVIENQLEQLQNELNKLSVIDKSIITLMLEGLSSKEIANIIGLTESNIRVKTHRIKEELRQTIKFTE